MSPSSIPAALRIGVLRYSRHAPWYFTAVCVKGFPLSFPITGMGPRLLFACLNSAFNTRCGTSTTGLTPILKIRAENVIYENTNIRIIRGDRYSYTRAGSYFVYFEKMLEIIMLHGYVI